MNEKGPYGWWISVWKSKFETKFPKQPPLHDDINIWSQETTEIDVCFCILPENGMFIAYLANSLTK